MEDAATTPQGTRVSRAAPSGTETCLVVDLDVDVDVGASGVVVVLLRLRWAPVCLNLVPLDAKSRMKIEPRPSATEGSTLHVVPGEGSLRT